MQRPLDPMSVQRTETPSASYVPRRRYGSARYVIAAVGWLTVFSLLLQPVAALAGTSVWPGGSGNWSSAVWTEPTSTDDATFPDPGGTIILSAGEQARSLSFLGSYTLTSGTLTLGGSGGVTVSGGSTVSISSVIGGAGGLTKAGRGVLVLASTATYSGTTTISAGTLRASTNLAFPAVASASLRLRLESDSGVTTSGSNVTAWNDQSGNGFHCSQGTADRQPTFVTGASPNGFLPAVRFDGLRDGTGDYLSSSSQLQAGGNGTTFFVVYRPQTTVAGGTSEDIMFFFGAASPGQMRGVVFAHATGNPLGVGFAGYASGDQLNKYNVFASTDHLATFSLNDARNYLTMYDRVAGDGSSSVKWEGAESGLNNTGAGYALSGAGVHSVNYPYKGDICAVLVYTGQLSDTDRQKVDDYLYDKYMNPSLYYGGLALPSGTTLAVGGSGTFDMNGNQQTVAALTDSGGSGGTVRNSNTSRVSTLTLGGTDVGSVSFSGTIQSGGANGVLNMAFTGSSSISQTLSGNVTLNTLSVSNPNATVSIDNSAASILSLAVSAGTVNFRSTAFGTPQTVTTTLTTLGLQTFIPTSSGNAEFHIWGAGGGGRLAGTGPGGGGGYTTGTLALTAGKTYQLMVGGGGAGVSDNTAPPSAPVGGGGQTGSIGYAGQGGGLSGIFETRYDWAHSLAIAGGGGGAGIDGGTSGGAGGGASGANGSGSNFGACGTETGPGVNGYYTVGDTLLNTIRSDALQGGGSWQGGDDGGGGGSGYIGGAGVSGATTTAGSGATPGNTSSPYYVTGTGAGSIVKGGNGRVTLVAPGITGAAVTLTGGTVNFGDTGTGAAVASADFSSPGTGVARANYALPLTIGSYLKLPGGAVASISGAASFTASGNNLADHSAARTLTLSGGTLTLLPPPVQKFTTPGAATYTSAVAGNVTFHLWGGGGGGCYYDGSNKHTGGGGGYTTGNLALTAGKTYPIMVGGGGLRMPNVSNQGPAVQGGGGLAGTSGYGGQGGGLSGIFDTAYAYANALAIAGGGGGGGCLSDGGAGGGTTGQSGVTWAGHTATGGNQTAGGTDSGGTGTQLQGAQPVNPDNGGGGGGGGGYWGGGAGDNGAGNNGGGGGSGYVDGAGVSDATTTAGNLAVPGNTAGPYYIAGRGVGGAAANDSTTSSGGAGLVVLVFPTDLPSTHVAVNTRASVLDLGGAVGTSGLGGLHLSADLTLRNVAAEGGIRFGGDVVTDGSSAISLAAGAGSAPALTLAGTGIRAANGATLVLPGASLTAASVALGNASGYNGTVRMGGAVTLAGGTTANVNVGTLSVTGTLAGNGGANVQVNDGATLAGNGSIGVPVTINSGGIVMPDAGASSAALMNGASLTLADGGKFQWIYADPTHKGTLALGGNTLNLPASGHPVFRPQFASVPAVGAYVITWTAGQGPANRPAWNVDSSLLGSGLSAIWGNGNGSWDTGANWIYATYTATVNYAAGNDGLVLASVGSGGSVPGAAPPAAGATVTVAPPTSAASVAVSGPSAAASPGVAVIRGNGNATATLTLVSGGTLSPGSLTVRAGGSLAATDAPLNLPTGTLVMDGGSVTLGHASTFVGTANVSGGSLFLTGGTISAANVSGTALLTATGGSIPSLTVTGSDPASGVTIGAGATAGVASLLVSGGKATFNNTNAVPLATLCGGTTTLNGPVVTAAHVSGSDTVVNITGGSVASLNVSNGLVRLDGAGTIQIASLDGGETRLAAGRMTRTDVSGRATFMALGGALTTLNANSGSAVQVNGATVSGIATLDAAAGSFTLSSGSLADFRIPASDAVNPTLNGGIIAIATIDAGGIAGTVVLGSAVAISALTVNGGAVSRPSGSVATLTVNGGTLAMGGDVSTATLSGGAVAFDNAASTTLGHVTVSGSGTTVTFASPRTFVSGDATGLTVSGGLVSFAGGSTGDVAALNVSGGSVNLAGQTIRTAVVTGGAVTGYRGKDESDSSLTVSGAGTSLTTGSGAVVRTADLKRFAGAVTVNALANPLTVRGNGGAGTLRLQDVTAIVDDGDSVRVSGANIVNDNQTGGDARVLELAGETLTLSAEEVAFPAVASASLRLRLESDAGVVTSGDKVIAWDDQSGNGYNAGQGTPANQPTLVSGASVNGRRGVVRFDGSRDAAGDYLRNTTAVMPDSAMTLFVVYRPQVNPGGANSEQVTFYWGQGGGGRLRGLYFRGPSSPLSAGFADYGGGDFGVDRFTVAAGTQYLSTFRMQDLSTLQEYIYNKYFTLASSITMQNTTIILPAGSTVRLDSSAGVALGALRLAGSATITGNGAAGGFTPATLQVGSLTVPATGGLSVPNIPLTLADGARLTVFGARGMKVTAISGAARITGHFTDEQGRIVAEGETGRFNGTDYRVSYAGGKVVLKEDDTGTVIRVQ